MPVKRYLIDISLPDSSLNTIRLLQKSPKKRVLSSPTVDLKRLSLALRSKVKTPLSTMRLMDLVTQLYSVLMASEQKAQLKLDLIQAKNEYEQELKLAKKYNYLDGKNRIPKKISIRQ